MGNNGLSLFFLKDLTFARGTRRASVQAEMKEPRQGGVLVGIALRSRWLTTGQYLDPGPGQKVIRPDALRIRVDRRAAGRNRSWV